MSRKKGASTAEGKKGKVEKTRTEAASRTESKLSEIIPPVPVALLENHPALPVRQEVLDAFAHDYAQVLARAVEWAQKLAEPEVKPAKKGRAPVDPPTLPQARPVTEDRGRPTQMALPELHLSTQASEASGPETERTSEPLSIGAESAFEPPPTVSAPESEVDAAEGDDADAFFASFREDRLKTEEDFLFAKPAIEPPAGPSEDATRMIAAMPDDEPASSPSEGATVMISAMSDDEPTPTEDRTTMIQAMPDDGPDETPAEATSEAAGDSKTRKSRKATKRKRG